MTQIQLRRGTAAEWASRNPVLAVGEAGYEKDTNKLKFGDGASRWNQLSYFSPGGGGGSSNITVRRASVDYLTPGLLASSPGDVGVLIDTPNNGEILIGLTLYRNIAYLPPGDPGTQSMGVHQWDVKDYAWENITPLVGLDPTTVALVINGSQFGNGGPTAWSLWSGGSLYVRIVGQSPTGQKSSTTWGPAGLPVTIIAGINDEYVWTTDNGSTTEVFTVAPGALTTTGQVLAALNAAIGAAHGERFDTLAAWFDTGAPTAGIATEALTAALAPNGQQGIASGANDAINAIFDYSTSVTTFNGGYAPQAPLVSGQTDIVLMFLAP